MTTKKTTLLALALLLATAAAGTAQTAPSAKAPAENDQVVSLSEFQVSAASSSNSYIASETMTGSRINTKIADLPYSIVNLTSEFFNDFNVEILDENMTYIGGLTNINIGGSFNLRGFSATSQLKDGFYRLGRYGLSNIDRVEIIRGPNAAIYGRSSPGGMINFVSLQPKKQVVQELDFSQGSYKQQKVNLEMTGAIGSSGSTYYVLDLNKTSRAFPGEWAQIRNNEDFLAIEHDFSGTSHLKISAEYFLQMQTSPQAPAPLLSVARAATPDNTATSTVVGYDTALASFSPYGPQSELNRGSDTFEVTYDKEFNDIFSTRIGAYRFGSRRWDYNQNTGWGAITVPLAGSPVTTTRGSIPSRGEIQEDGGGFQADLVAHYFLAHHTIDAKTLLTVDLNDYYRWDPTWEYGPSTDPALVSWAAASSGRVVTLTPQVYKGRIEYVPSAPLTYFPNWYNDQTIEIFGPTGGSLNGGTLTRRRTVSLGGNLREQMTMLDGKLILYAGLRNDNVLFSERDYTVQFASVGFGNKLAPGTGGAGQPGGSVVRRYEHQNKPNVGFNYQVIPHLHVYGSYSTAYFVDQTSRPSVIAASTYQPFTAKGFDYGIKGTYLDDRLNFTIGGYYAKQFNVLVNDVVESPVGSGNFISVQRQDGDQLVRGLETDLSYVITNSLTIGESFGEVNSKYTYYGSANPEVIGRSVNGVTPENGSVYLKYAPTSGPLSHFYFNALTTYVSSTPSQVPSTGDTTAIVNGVAVVTAHTDAWKVRIPSYQLWNFAVHYKLPRLNDHWDQDISLNLNNAFDKYYLKTNATRGDSRGVMVEYHVTHLGYPSR